ncbi:hypothetical protein [Streptomyces noursei]|uniref:hypothetical protein n=1 Tax=Streptomyces noursei TaxID=1971 RepID=UPI00167AE5E4|nr:hypothetical protein [Streptomyces noursei]MCZ1013399.1 hypothetical protein [Streptomyces noursei]GGX47973.1 hypothetical protein GCM10010341_82040 [Streptomyces noursei]
MTATGLLTAGQDVNLYHGGRSSDLCPRCRHGRNTKSGPFVHGLKELTDSEKLRQVLARVAHNLQQDKDLIEKNPEQAYFMMGALEAQVAGEQYFLISSSGRQGLVPWIETKHLDGIPYHPGKWEIVNSQVPETPDRGWTTLMGQKADLTPICEALREGQQCDKVIGQPCAAIKLLRTLADRNKNGRPINRLYMSEMVYVHGTAKVPQNLRAYHGNGNTCSWTAHSCDKCEKRIPYLLCTVPLDHIEAEAPQ